MLQNRMVTHCKMSVPNQIGRRSAVVTSKSDSLSDGPKTVGSVALNYITMLFLLIRNFAPHCLFTQVSNINGYRRHISGGNPTTE